MIGCITHSSGHFGFHHYPTIPLTLQIILMDSLTLKTYEKLQNISLQDKFAWSFTSYNDAAAILDAILNYTFLPHIWNVYPRFFQPPRGPLQGSRIKIRGHMIAHRTPLSPRTIKNTHIRVFLHAEFICAMKIVQNPMIFMKNAKK